MTADAVLTPALSSSTGRHVWPSDTAEQRRGLVKLPAEGVHVGSARQFARWLLTRWGVDEDIRDSALLVISELAGNAVRHGHGYMTVEIACATGKVAVTVTSQNHARADARGDLSDPCEHGRGLHIVGALADLTVDTTLAGWTVQAVLRAQWKATEPEREQVDREAREQAAAEEDARLRSQLAAQHPELAARSEREHVLVGPGDPLDWSAPEPVPGPWD